MQEKIHLLRAVMIAGLGGWGNAGEASTFSVKYLVDRLGATKFSEIPSERFHDFFGQRPIVTIEQGVVKSYDHPRNDLFYWKNKKGGLDLVLLLGHEPHLNWPEYARAILKVAKESGVQRIYTLGGFLADVSHEGEAPITASTNNEELAAELKRAGVDLTNYHGPTSVYSEVLWRAREEGVDVVSLWCAVPLYVTGMYAKAAYSLLKKIAELTSIKLDLKDLEERAKSSKRELEKEALSQAQTRDLIDILRRRTQEREPSYIL